MEKFFPVGKLSAFLSYATQYTKPFNEISGVVTELQNALACADRVLDLIEEEPLSPDAPDTLTVSEGQGHIELKNVDFSYTKEKELIKNFNLDVKPGQRVAIVGPTGCGKTTLINLLMRFYDVDSGSISVEGKDIRNVTRNSLRSNYGMVLQETWLFGGTIAENIAYGTPGATREQIIQAARSARIHRFIMSLPDGYDTILTDEGAGISKGQRQLLAIARCFLTDADIVILDEATSNVDTETERAISLAMENLRKGRTCFVIAHRLATIRGADCILVLDEGGVAEQGTHEELLAKDGVYAGLYRAQWAGFTDI